MFSKLQLYSVLALVWAASVVGTGYWQRIDARADFKKEIAAAVAEKRLSDLKERQEIEDAIENTPDSDLIDLIVDGGWLLED